VKSKGKPTMDMNKFKPSALIVGAQKAGTTAMLKNLSQHPEIFGSTQELNYFSSNYEKGNDWYLKQISKPLAAVVKQVDEPFIIEKSPSYLSDPDAAERIHTFNQDMKIIVCLRNPVERAYSRYNDIVVDNPDKAHKPFDQLIDIKKREPSHFLKNGFYASSLVPYFNIFGAENIKYVVQERWKKYQHQTLSEVTKFLGFDDMPEIEVRKVHANPYEDDIDQEIFENLKSYFAPMNEQLFELIGERIPEWD
jgi:hypothetical protein